MESGVVAFTGREVVRVRFVAMRTVAVVAVLFTKEETEVTFREIGADVEFT